MKAIREPKHLRGKGYGRKAKYPAHLLNMLPLFSLLASAAAYVFLPQQVLLLTLGKNTFGGNKAFVFFWPVCVALCAWGIVPALGRLLLSRYPLFPCLPSILAWGTSGILCLLQFQRLHMQLFPKAWNLPIEYTVLFGLAMFTVALGIYVLRVVVSGKRTQ